ncbi:MAG: 5-formyltetrahydrofolate cyclo-ligase [Clostridiales bacterium]|nr:5-formyltetrahydrofolate cyclo-ligase [Clostridiales bacterium]
MKEIKKQLRREIREKINSLPAEYIEESDAGIAARVCSLPEFINAKTIFTFYSIGREPDTHRIIRRALEMGKTVSLPVCFKGGIMEARAIKDIGELRPSQMMGLMEPLDSKIVIAPEEIDFIVVPALAYDEEGYRVGYGGGYYDRFLVRTKAYTVGITREALMMDAVPREAHDIPVQCIVTEKKARLLRESR